MKSYCIYGIFAKKSKHVPLNNEYFNIIKLIFQMLSLADFWLRKVAYITCGKYLLNLLKQYHTD